MKILRYESNVYASTLPYLTSFHLPAVPTYTILQRQGGGIMDSTYRSYGSCAGNFSGMDTYLT